jgi:SagB-type dehydrogenase family enzyme
MKQILVILLLAFAVTQVAALETIKLSQPDVDSMPLMKTLQERKSTKAFDSKPIDNKKLSSLLWAAFGVNRPGSEKRTAATAFNCQDIDIYVVFAEGVYKYQAKDHCLIPVLSKDVRPLAATQAYAQKAPVNLVYISDYAKINDRYEAMKPVYSAFHAGSISQNVYLYCASAGLGTVVRDGVNREALSKALKLSDTQVVIMGQTVGYPTAPPTKP